VLIREFVNILAYLSFTGRVDFWRFFLRSEFDELLNDSSTEVIFIQDELHQIG
jgi:hypothetical protein